MQQNNPATHAAGAPRYPTLLLLSAFGPSFSNRFGFMGQDFTVVIHSRKSRKLLYLHYLLSWQYEWLLPISAE